MKFTASWCGPCHRIQPLYISFVKLYPHITFVEVDATTEDDVVSMANVKLLPTFVFYNKSKEIHRIEGARDQELINFVSSLEDRPEVSNSE
jgi:thiol-disulfide isomerase/thioredoxin